MKEKEGGSLFPFKSFTLRAVRSGSAWREREKERENPAFRIFVIN